MSEEHWSLEAFDRSGRTFVHVRQATADGVAKTLLAALKDERTGGVVVYLPTGSVAKGNKQSYCRYCETTGGHTADCPVIS